MATPAASPFRPLPVPPPHQVPPSPPQTVQQAQASTLAVFAAEMIVWIWFSPTTTALNADVNTTRTEHMDETERGTTEAKRRQAQTASKQQVAPTERFLRFTHEVLSTTQVSHSVVILALLFIFRLKKRNSISGAPGSEFRLTCTALMLANKVLDDNTYQAKTWAEVSSLELEPLVAGEAEFLRGLDWNLHVTERDFGAWLKLLEGHVAARNSHIVKTSRKSSSARKSTPNDSMGLVGLGLGGTAMSYSNSVGGASLQAPATSSSRMAASSSTQGRRGSGGAPPLASSNTPAAAFATFTFPAPAPSSAPLRPSYSTSSSTAVSPLSTRHASVSRSHRVPSSSRHSHGHSHSVSHSFPTPPLSANGFPPPPLSRAKRGADEAFTSPDGQVSAFEAAPAAKRIQSTWIARSYSDSTGAAPAPRRTVYVHPGHLLPSPAHPSAISPTEARFPSPLPPISSGFAPDMQRIGSSGSSHLSQHGRPIAGLPPSHSHLRPETLADAFSPRYNSQAFPHTSRPRPESLDFYSLAAGQPRQGVQHRAQVPPPPTAAPTYIPSHLGSFSTSPYSHTSLPSTPISYGTSMSRGSFSKTSPPLRNLIGNGGQNEFSQYSNAGLPGVYWASGTWQTNIRQ